MRAGGSGDSPGTGFLSADNSGAGGKAGRQCVRVNADDRYAGRHSAFVACQALLWP